MRHTVTRPDDITETAQVENILRTANKLFSFDNRGTKSFSHHDLERYLLQLNLHLLTSASSRNFHNINNVNHDVLELKILLLKLKHILMEVGIYATHKMLHLVK